LICLHFFKGKGYSDEFVENLRRVVEKAKSDYIKVVDYADDVCKACPHNLNGVCTYSENANEEVKALDDLALKLLGINVGDLVLWRDLKVKIPKVLNEWKLKACKDCDWRDVCDL